MTVPVQTTFTASTANGVTTSFPYAFKITDADDLEVSVDGVVQTTGFTVTGVGAELGGSVAFDVAPTNGARVIRALSPILKRTTDYQQFGDWNSDEVDNDFDRIWLALQALSQTASRALKLPKDTADDQVTPTGATADERADKLIGFDASGDPVLLAQSDLEYAVEAAASAADAASSASDAADSASSIASGSQTVTNLVCTGGTINGTAIGGTTRAAVSGTTGNFNGGLTVTGGNTTTRGISDTATATALTLSGSGANSLTIANSASNPTIGTSAGDLQINGSTGKVAQFTSSSTPANYVRFESRSTGAAPIIWAEGSDTNVGLEYRTQNAGSHLFITDDSTGPIQVAITHTASANRYITLTGSNGGNPKIATSGGSLDIGSAVVFTGQTVGTTVGAAGGASALPATPLGYLTTSINGTACKIPYYN